jgi:hypothetical protein
MVRQCPVAVSVSYSMTDPASEKIPPPRWYSVSYIVYIVQSQGPSLASPYSSMTLLSSTIVHHMVAMIVHDSLSSRAMLL